MNPIVQQLIYVLQSGGYPSIGNVSPMPGRIGTPGNLNMTNRPKVTNPDGSYSTVRSATFTLPDGRSILLPTVIGGKVEYDNRKVWDNYTKTGQHLGIFPDNNSAEAAAQVIHQQQAQMYNRR